MFKQDKQDRQGKPISELHASAKTKSVYDSSEISTNQYIKPGFETASSAAKNSTTEKLGYEWSGTDSKGIKLHGYCDDSGNLTTFYPEDQL